MARSKPNSPSSAKNSSASLGFEAKLWHAADKLRSNMDAAEYKHVVLGLIFLKYISDLRTAVNGQDFGGSSQFVEDPKGK
jgi:type I restriction enzyme M protein